MFKQLGLGLIGLLILLTIGGYGAIVGMKVVPLYTQYFSIKKAIRSTLITTGTGSVQDMKERFERETNIGYITDITSNDLIIKKNGEKTTITLSYEKVIPVAGQLSLLFTFDVEDHN